MSSRLTQELRLQFLFVKECLGGSKILKKKQKHIKQIQEKKREIDQKTRK
jgi:hypothetical protein